jgi:hypothetical protein
MCVGSVDAIAGLPKTTAYSPNKVTFKGTLIKYKGWHQIHQWRFISSSNANRSA